MVSRSCGRASGRTDEIKHGGWGFLPQKWVLAALLPIARPGVSRHLRVLREAGLVEVRADAQRRVYRLRTEPLREIDEWLAPYRATWAGRLGALEAHLDDMEN